MSEDYPKVKTVTVNEFSKLVNFMISILNIKIQSQEDEKAMDVQMGLIIDLIRKKFGYLTIPEIQEAFKMYVSKEFPDIKVFRILDCISVSEILKAYTDFRNESLRIYQHKKNNLLQAKKTVSSEEKEAIRKEFIKHLFDELTQNGFCDDAKLLYDELFESGKLLISDSKKKQIYENQVELLIENLKSKAISRVSKEINLEAEKIRKMHSEKIKIPEAIEKSKAVAVCDYLSDYLEDLETFKTAF